MNEKPSFLSRVGTIFSKYISCNLLDAVIIGAANALFLYIMKMPHIALIAVTAGVTNMIPTVGPVIGAVIGAALLLFGEPLNALWFVLFTVVLQLLDSYLIRPKLFGSSLGVPALGVLIATLIGAHFFGIFGLLLAVPVAAVLLMLVKDMRGKALEDDDEQDG